MIKMRIKEWVKKISILIDEEFVPTPRSEIKLVEVQERTQNGNWWCIVEHQGHQIRTPILTKHLEEVKSKGEQQHFRTPACPNCLQDMKLNLIREQWYCKKCNDYWKKMPRVNRE